jgi:oligoendopeptidase F
MQPPKWDLEQLRVGSPDEILEAMRGMPARATAFVDEYRGKISRQGPKALYAFIERKDALFIDFEAAWLYSRLAAAASTDDPVAGKLNSAAVSSMSAVFQAFTPLDVELGKRLVAHPELIEAEALRSYRHHLEKVRRSAAHLLSEKEEKLIIDKDKNGIVEWSQLQRAWLSTRPIKVTLEGKEQSLSLGQVYGLIYGSQEREKRREASLALLRVLGENEVVWAHALRSICADHAQICHMRGFSSPEEASYVTHDVDGASIEAMMRVTEKNRAICHAWMATKAKMLGLEKLASYDMAAPIPIETRSSYSWEEGRKIVLESFTAFDPQLGKWAEDMFDGRRIDGEVRAGKSAGAFCEDWLGGKASFILQSYNGNLKDVYTLAHELGHAMHGHLYSRAQRPSNCRISSCVAECGSTFSELLLTDHLLSKATSSDQRREILAEVLSAFDTCVFMIAARYRLESSLYKAVDAGDYLDGETISKLWIDARDSIYGGAVDFPEESKWDWARVPHYFISDLRFYNYPYSFAQLFTFSLYGLYKEQGKDFVPRFKALLAAGSSRPASELAKDFGFDLGEEEFWQKGMDQAKEFLRQIN